jgi:DNA polymerase
MKDSIEKVNRCNLCLLCENVKNRVYGEGNPDSGLILIGEAPGRKEDEAGRPFVGSAGRLLDKILEESGFKREDIYITNIVKCRPPGNRRPKRKEVESCSVHLKEQFSIIQPKIVAPMGNSALDYIFKLYKIKKEPIGEVHGKALSANTYWGNLKIIPLFHPAAAIYNRKLYESLVKDLLIVKKNLVLP